jgi:malonate decarboxylase delta subunit
MEKIHLEYPAQRPAPRRCHVGVVGSGDLEVLAEPGTDGRTVIDISTSVDGSGPVWTAQMERLFAAGQLPAVKLEINDFGATPGVVQMRIAQAFEEIGHD